MTTKENGISKQEVESAAKSIIKHPVTKIAVAAVGTVALCYTAIFVMNLLAKMMTSYKGLQKAPK